MDQESPAANRHVQVLRDALVAEHEETIAVAERRASEAVNEDARRFYLDHARRLRAIPYPWEQAS